MSPLKQYIRHLLTDNTVLYECRNCGETLEKPDKACPACDSTETAEYELLR